MSVAIWNAVHIVRFSRFFPAFWQWKRNWKKSIMHCKHILPTNWLTGKRSSTTNLSAREGSPAGHGHVLLFWALVLTMSKWECRSVCWVAAKKQNCSWLKCCSVAPTSYFWMSQPTIWTFHPWNGWKIFFAPIQAHLSLSHMIDIFWTALQTVPSRWKITN